MPIRISLPQLQRRICFSQMTFGSNDKSHISYINTQRMFAPSPIISPQMEKQTRGKVAGRPSYSTTGGQCYKTFSVRNLRIFVIS